MDRPRRLPITVADLRFAVWSLLSTAAGLGIAVAVVDGVTVRSPWAVLPAALAVGAGDALLRVPLRRIARASGALGALVLGLGAQVLVVLAVLRLLPGISSRSWADAVAVLLIAAVVMAVGHWLVGASDNAYVVGDLVRQGRRRAGLSPRGGAGEGGQEGTERPPGVLVVMLDGVSRATLDHALEAGLTPTLERWLGGGSHRVESWWARVPCSTPASTLGLLHGTTDEVPAFRWWSREQGRLVVTNRPADAAAVERRASDGRGLLAGGGAAVSTMFSGDAATSLLVMSRASAGLGPGQMFVRFFASPFVLVRAVVGTVAEALKELYQGWQQTARGVRPRVPRHGWYPVLRAVTNVLLRDLNTSLVAEQLVRGVPVVAVDLVDYDEIAHHAGPLRPESLRALEGLDRVLGLWQEVADGAPRRYRVVVVSDHGQSLGATFEQVNGRSLGQEVRMLMAARGAAPRSTTEATGHDVAESEAWGPANTALHALRRGDGEEARVLVGPDREPSGWGHREGAPPAQELPEVAVVGSGNLGMVWFCREPGPVDGAEVARRWPALLPGLLANPAVGVVVVRDGGEVVAHGRDGAHRLVGGEVDGKDPLAGYGTRARADLLRVARLPEAGDLVLLSAVDPMGRVHAFEGLVGSHGGLGGDQSEAVLVHPVELVVPDGERQDVDGSRMLVGAESVHRRMVAWLDGLGLREGL
ncbi:alkaline phosphatase family protein [Isoptericola cucumis]|uniref:Membrane protein n=2 Tax=Isoptericola cucumis TaxID=1776856 RepID=A0ABQ2B4M2_9MICO|nr:alkaline phosphatase family protein [Isoptericola cucumis]GGI07839.1 membrane protein [Isoptericola cucumis]